jgi:signal transduction histidine kinase
VTPLGRRPIRHQVRAIIVVLILFVAVVAGTSLVTLLAQGRSVRVLTLSMGPAQDASVEVRQVMTEANGQLGLSLAGVVARPVELYREPADEQLRKLGDSLALDVLSEAHRSTYAALVAREHAAVSDWFDAAARAQAARSGPLSGQGESQDAADRSFRSFRDVDRQLEERIEADRGRARTGSRGALATELTIMLAVTAAALLLILLGGRLLSRSTTDPLVRLSGLLDRQRDGDREALADPEAGASEVRALAANFNGLTRANQVLQEQQAEVLLMHQLALDVARSVQVAPDARTALSLVCAMLGEGLGVDRVLLYTYDDEGLVEERTQYHRYDLPDLLPLPRSLAREVSTIAAELRQHASVFAAKDFLDPEIQEQPRAQAFHRVTGARSVLMAPVGLAEGGLGVLALVMVDTTRRWRRHEIQAVQQAAGLVAQAVVSLRLAQMQDEQVHRLTELDRQKTDFMATVSHELRTPLTSINGYLEMLEDGDYGELTRPQLGAVSVIERNAIRLRGLIEDLLVLNKIEAAGLQSSLEDVPVGGLVAGVVEMLAPVAEGGGLRVEVDPVDEQLCVHVDRGQLERALINLGSNAVKFTPRGGVVTIGATLADDGRVQVCVTDTGIGIPVADQARLSERFFRASNAADAAIPGTGLGLAIVRTIVEGHGGQLQVESVEGEGTTMRVLLWAAGAHAAYEGNVAAPGAV